jgi:hypothetical protein
MNNIEKAAYRKHEGGIWTSLNEFEKFKKTMISKQMIKDDLKKNIENGFQ